MYTAFGCATVLFCIQQLRRLRRPNEPPLPLIALATIGVAVASYNLAYLLVSDLYALILIATTVHSLQYHVISWRRNRGRFSRDLGPGGSLLRLFADRNSPLLYAAFFVAVGSVLASLETVLLGFFPLVFVLQHFYLDRYLWRSSLNPTLAADLGIVPASHPSR
jgi:hypothetical protein